MSFNHPLPKFTPHNLNVLADPTFGYTTEATYGYVDLPNRIVGGIFTCPEAGTGDSITALLDNITVTSKYKCALYLASDLSLVSNGTTEERTGLSGKGWYTFDFPVSPDLINVPYLIVVWTDLSGWIWYDQTGAGRYKDETYGAWPDPLVSPTSLDRVFSIYCTYTPAAPPVVGGVHKPYLTLTL